MIWKQYSAVLIRFAMGASAGRGNGKMRRNGEAPMVSTHRAGDSTQENWKNSIAGAGAPINVQTQKDFRKGYRTRGLFIAVTKFSVNSLTRSSQKFSTRV